MRSLFVALGLLILLTSVAHAENRAKARELFKQAQQHYKLGEFQPALDGFKEAFRNFEDPSLLFNIAQCERQLGHKQEALRSYRMFLSEVPNAPNRAEVENLIATLDQAIKDEAAAQPPQNTLPPTEKPAQPTQLPAPPPPAPPPPPPRHTWWMIGVGAGLLAVGAVGIGTGAGALAVNGQGSCSPSAGQVRCPKVYNTAGEGGALLGVGIAAAAAGAALIIVEERRYHASVHASIMPSPSGGAFVLSGEF
jgi:tetratricopeptide (TPR) repeat protein